MGIVSNHILVENLEVGMILGEDIIDDTGNTLLARGQELRNLYIDKIEKLGTQQVLILEISKGHDQSEEYEYEDDNEHIKRKLIAEETRDEAQKAIKECMDSVLKDCPFGVGKLVLVIDKIISEILNSEDVTINLAELKSVDDYTFRHSVNVSVFAIVTGIALGLNKNELIELGMGAILHDIGKMLIPDEILNKPGVLNDNEFDIIKIHPVYGYEVLRKISDVSENSAKVALHHHERFDGKGYPDELINGGIHIYSKIVAVVDVFDALTSNRVYSRKVSPYKAMEYIISMAEAHFESVIISKFIKFVGYYYRGQMVRLNTGEVAVVNQKHQSKPVVRVVLDNNGKRVKDFYEIDLNKNPTILINSIMFYDKAFVEKIVEGRTS